MEITASVRGLYCMFMKMMSAPTCLQFVDRPSQRTLEILRTDAADRVACASLPNDERRLFVRRVRKAIVADRQPVDYVLRNVVDENGPEGEATKEMKSQVAPSCGDRCPDLLLWPWLGHRWYHKFTAAIRVMSSFTIRRWILKYLQIDFELAWNLGKSTSEFKLVDLCLILDQLRFFRAVASSFSIAPSVRCNRSTWRTFRHL